MAEETQKQENGTPEPPPDYSGMTDEQLELEFQKDAAQRAAPPEPAPAPEPEPEQKAEETPAEPEQPEQTPEVKADEQHPAEPDKAEPDFDETDARFQELSLQLREEQAQRKHAERLHGNIAGSLGEFKKTIRRLNNEIAGLKAGTTPPAEDLAPAEPVAAAPQQEPAEEPQQESWQAELLEEANQRALGTAVDTFCRDNGMYDDSGALTQAAEQTLAKMTPIVAEQTKKYAELNLTPKTRRNMLGDLLEIAYARVEREQIMERRKAWKEKKASSVDESRIAKQAATISGSGSTPPAKEKVKGPEDMTAEEADKELIRLYGDGHQPIRR